MFNSTSISPNDVQFAASDVDVDAALFGWPDSGTLKTSNDTKAQLIEARQDRHGCASVFSINMVSFFLKDSLHLALAQPLAGTAHLFSLQAA
jgi:hypothetical protein